MKKIIVLTLVILLSLSLFSCAKSANEGSTKTFKVRDLNITLTDTFKKQAQQGYTGFYAASDAAVIFLEEFKEDLDGIATMEDYTAAVLKNNTADNMTELKTEDEITYFEFTAKVNRKEYKYMACFFEEKDAFWVIQFYSLQSDYDTFKPKFIDWASTVTFDE